MIQRLQKARTGDEAGFTLVELLVVIAILGILSAIVVFAVGGIKDKGQSSACKIDKRTLQTAEEAYATQNSGNYANQSDQAKVAPRFDELVPNFIAEAPVYHWVAATNVAATATTPATHTYTINPVAPC